MQSTGARIGLLAAVVVVAVVLFIVLNKDSGGDNGGGGSTTSASNTPQVINVVNGEPAGGVKKLTYNKGDQVRLRVDLDRPEEEIHVHGYEIEKPADKSPVDLSFPANIDGVFEIECHHPDGTEAQIAELRVNP